MLDESSIVVPSAIRQRQVAMLTQSTITTKVTPRLRNSGNG
jgi:hypothetical protein